MRNPLTIRDESGESLGQALATFVVVLSTIVVIWLCIGVASAATLFVMPNQAGGHIGLTDATCPNQPNEGLAYGRAPAGDTLLGCWTMDSSTGLVFIAWFSGQVSSYPASSFYVTPAYEQRHSGKSSRGKRPSVERF